MVRRLILLLTIATFAFVCFGQEKAETEKIESKKIVVQLTGDAPIRVKMDEIVRLTGGPAVEGSKAEVTGQAKIISENTLRMIAGAKTLTGALNREYEIKGTGKGKATVKLTMQFNPKLAPYVKTYEIEFE